MNSAEWNKLSTFEQLSNIAGDVKRTLDSNRRWKEGETKEDYSAFYQKKMMELIHYTLEDPKNHGRDEELLDEAKEVERCLHGEVSEEYIMRYWNQFTRAIS